MAACHGLGPLFFKRLKQSDARACVPADEWERLRVAYLAAAGRNMHRYRELRPVLRRLRHSGIPVIVLKGAYLAEAVYGDVALRPMGDVDLLVPRAELPRAQAILLDMGGVHQQTEDIESLCRKRHHLPPVVIRGVTIEIHWTIASPTAPMRIDAAGLLDRARPATIAGVEVLALSPEDLLLHLCLHLGRDHRFKGLKSLCDIDETIRRYGSELDWAQVVRSAREWRAAKYVGLTLHLARRMLGAGVPDDVLERLLPGGLDQQVLETAMESVLTQVDYRPWVPFFDVPGVRSLGGMVRLTWKRVFLSRDEMTVKYPASRGARHLGFYYVLRLRDGLRAFGAHALRRGRSRRSRGRGRRASLTSRLESGKPARQAEAKQK